MSNIPKAREMLQTLIRYEGMPPFAVQTVRRVLALLDREKPAGDFMVEKGRDDRPMTKAEVEEAIHLRFDNKWSVKRIAAHQRHNMARVSEAINGKRPGV